MIPISLQLYTLRDRAATDFFGVLKDVAAIGYVGVETAGLGGKSPKEVRKVCDDLGLVVSSSHTAVPTKGNLSELVDTARALGCSDLVSGLGPDDFKTADTIRAGAAKFAAAAELLVPYGLRLGYHNHWWEFDLVEGRYGYSWFFEQAAGVFSELDVYWACNFGKVDVPMVLTACGDNIPLLHVKDGPLVQGQPHTASGAGKMNLPAILVAAGPQVRWLVVELDECATDMTAAVAESYQYLTANGLAMGRC